MQRLRQVFIVCMMCCCVGLLCIQLYSNTGKKHRHSNNLITGRDKTPVEHACFSKILADFGAADLVAAASSQSVPVYIRPPRPIPIDMEVCKKLFANWTSAPEVNISQLNVLETDKQQRLPSILHQLATNFSQRNLEFFMSYGSLLGSLRQFDFFPWDGDLDVNIPAYQKPKIRQLLIDLSASDEFNFIDTEWTNEHWQMGIFCRAHRDRPLKKLYGGVQLYPEKSCPTIVDFFFGRIVGSCYTSPHHPVSLPAVDIYPLSLRPFGPYLIPAPNRPKNVIAASFGADYEVKCKFKYALTLTVDCKSLRSRCPFVAHVRGSQLAESDPHQPVLEVLVFKKNMPALFVPPV